MPSLTEELSGLRVASTPSLADCYDIVNGEEVVGWIDWSGEHISIRLPTRHWRWAGGLVTASAQRRFEQREE